MAKLAEQARRLNRAARSRISMRCCSGLALLSDARRLPDPRPLLSLLPPASLVVLRVYGDAGAAALAPALARDCRARRLFLLVAGDFDLAVRLRAGVHLPEWQARTAPTRILLWHRMRGAWLTAAAHGRAGLARAHARDADAALLAPVFANASHPDARPLGVLRFRSLTRHSRLAVFALGGVDAGSARMLAGSGAAGIATVGGLARG